MISWWRRVYDYMPFFEFLQRLVCVVGDGTMVGWSRYCSLGSLFLIKWKPSTSPASIFTPLPILHEKGWYRGRTLKSTNRWCENASLKTHEISTNYQWCQLKHGLFLNIKYIIRNISMLKLREAFRFSIINDSSANMNLIFDKRPWQECDVSQFRHRIIWCNRPQTIHGFQNITMNRKNGIGSVRCLPFGKYPLGRWPIVGAVYLTIETLNYVELIKPKNNLAGKQRKSPFVRTAHVNTPVFFYTKSFPDHAILKRPLRNYGTHEHEESPQPVTPTPLKPEYRSRTNQQNPIALARKTETDRTRTRVISPRHFPLKPSGTQWNGTDRHWDMAAISNISASINPRTGQCAPKSARATLSRFRTAGLPAARRRVVQVGLRN